MTYREYYELCIGREIKQGYEIHHIDHNRKNNDIINLVEIPFDLHRKYHKFHCKFKNSMDIIYNQFGFSSLKQRQKCIDSIIIFMECKDEILSYMFIRNELISRVN